MLRGELILVTHDRFRFLKLGNKPTLIDKSEWISEVPPEVDKIDHIKICGTILSSFILNNPKRR